MNIIKTPISDLLIIEPKVFRDDRGYFYESFSQKSFESVGITHEWVQDNESFSTYGTLRGLHFQKGDSAQAKLVRVVKGRVLDIAVDLRSDSTTFGQTYSVELSGENKRLFLVPRGFAHGFAVLSDEAIFNYKCDNYYDKDSESGIRFDDEDLKIDWKLNLKDIIISEKDKKLPTFRELFKK